MLNYIEKIGLFVLIVICFCACDDEMKTVQVGNSNKAQAQHVSDANTFVSKEEKMETTENKNSPILETQISLKEKVLQVEYKIRNTTAQTIYIFNVLPSVDSTGRYILAPQQAFVCFRDKNTLHVALQIPPLPKNRKVEVREIPYVTKIEAGKEYAKTISLPMPVEEYNIYFPKDGNSKEEMRIAEEVIFSLQFIRQSEKLEVEPTELEGAFSVWHPNLFGNVETLSSRPKPVSVQVNVRTDEFERF